MDESQPDRYFRLRPETESFSDERLLSVPSLEATLAWHGAIRARVETELDETTLDWDHPEKAKTISWLAWADEYQYLSHGFLVASMIGREVRKALQELGYQAPPRDPALVEDKDYSRDPDWPEDHEPTDLFIVNRLETMRLESEFLNQFEDPGDRNLLAVAIELASVLHSLNDEWRCDLVHHYFVNNMDQVTIDEMDERIPVVPRIEGLPNWNKSGDLWEDNFNFYVDPPTLIDCSTGVLWDLADLILSRKFPIE